MMSLHSHHLTHHLFHRCSFLTGSLPKKASTCQAAVAPSCSFSDHVEAFARYVMRVVQTLTPVVQAAAPPAGYCAWLISRVIRSAENTARAILRKLARRPLQNEENIAVPSPQDAAVFINPKYCDSPVQFLEEIARANRYNDVYSLALKITRRGRDITDWERGDLIGKGSFASVYRGSNEDGFFFAAKGVSLNEHRHLCHLENEIAILKRLDHENIIQYYGTQKDGEMLYIFLELVSHGTLEQAYRNFCFKQPQVSHYTRQILQGLRYPHSCKVVHGDVKCANILVTESGRIKLAEFGLSTRMEDLSQTLKLGWRSSYWTAPEVANPKRGGYGFPSDIWSLGCTVAEMSTRKHPQYINGKNPLKLDRAIRSGKGPVVPDYLSDTLKDFINQCLQPHPNQRPTAAELLAHPFVNESSCPQPDLTELLFNWCQMNQPSTLFFQILFIVL